MNNPDTNPEYVKIPEAARMLNVTQRWIYRRIWDGLLPASKVGGFYFIRRQDLQALLAQGQVNPRANREEAHSVEAQPLRCGYCFRLMESESLVGEVCRQEGCSELICTRCLADGVAFCARHVPGREQRWEEAQERFRKGELAVLVKNEIARLRELNFLNRLQARLERFSTLVHPLTGEAISVSNWPAILERGDESAEVMRLLGKVALETDLAARTPLNPWARYRLPAAKNSKSGPVEIEAHLLSRLPEALRDGFDTRSIGLEELAFWLGALSDETLPGRPFRILVLAATPGWSASAREVILGGASAGNLAFMHRLSLLYLFDLQTGELIFNPQDERARRYAELFRPSLPSEEVEEAVQAIQKQLVVYESLTLQYAAQTLPFPADLLKQAFDKLAATGQYALTEVPELGAAIVRV